MICLCLGFFVLMLRLLRRSHVRPKAAQLSVYLTPGDVTPAGAEAYARGWVGFPSLHSKVNCSQAITSPRRNFMYPQTVPRATSGDILKQCRNNCKAFAENNGFNRYPRVTKEELRFPIAFIILFHQDLDQVSELTLSVNFQHRYYCML